MLLFQGRYLAADHNNWELAGCVGKAEVDLALLLSLYWVDVLTPVCTYTLHSDVLANLHIPVAISSSQQVQQGRVALAPEPVQAGHQLVRHRYRQPQIQSNVLHNTCITL